MPKSKRRARHCRNIAKKRRKILNSDDDESTDEEIERVDNQIENEAEQFFSVLMKNMETLKLSKRPLVNLGNSRTTKYRQKIQALKNQKKNGQTLFQLLSKNKSQETSDSEETQNSNKEINKTTKYMTFINQIENKFKSKINN